MPRTSIGIGKVACLDGLKITEEQTPQGIVLAIHGNVGIEEVDLLAKHFQSILDRAPALVVLDLSGVSFIASAGMGAMIALRRDVGKKGGQVRLAAIRPQVKEALRRALFDRIFQMHDSVQQALSAK